MTPSREPRIPQQKRSQDRVTKILDATEALIVEQGLEGITAHTIARKAGVAPAGVYFFFPDHKMVFEALAQRNNQYFNKILPKHLVEPDIKTWTDLMAAIFTAITEFCIESKSARAIYFGLEGKYFGRWTTTIYSAQLADFIQRLFAHFFDTPEIKRLNMKYVLVGEIIFSGYVQAIKKGDPIDHDVIAETQEAVEGYMSRWIGDPKRKEYVSPNIVVAGEALSMDARGPRHNDV